MERIRRTWIKKDKEKIKGIYIWERIKRCLVIRDKYGFTVKEIYTDIKIDLPYQQTKAYIWTEAYNEQMQRVRKTRTYIRIDTPMIKLSKRQNKEAIK